MDVANYEYLVDIEDVFINLAVYMFQAFLFLCQQIGQKKIGNEYSFLHAPKKVRN